MLSKHVKSAFNNLIRDPFTHLTAVVCLAVGLAAFALLISFCLYYYSFDKHVDNYEHWYRLRVSTGYQEIPEDNYATFYRYLIENLVTEIPEIEDFVDIGLSPSLDIRFTSEEGNVIPLGSTFFVSSNLPEHYNMKFIYGSSEITDSTPISLIMSRSFAKKHFFEENIIGEQIYSEEGNSIFTVVGVFEDLPGNIHLRDEVYRLSSIPHYYSHDDEYRFYDRSHIRVRISDKRLVPVVEDKINIILSQADPNPNIVRICHLDPISDIHFIQGLLEDQKTINKSIIHSLMLVAFFVLITAILNFINLINLTWQKRNSEFVFRKIHGATRKELMFQLFTEYTVFYFLSSLVFLILYGASRNIFSDLTALNLINHSLFVNFDTALIVLVVLLTGWLISIIPAAKYTLLSCIAEEQRNRIKRTGINIILFSQILLSSVFIISALSIYSQTRLINSFDPGFKTENMLQCRNTAMSDTGDLPYYSDLNMIMYELQQIPEITSFSYSVFDITEVHPMFNLNKVIPQDESNTRTSEADAALVVGPGFFETLGIDILFGDISDVRFLAMGDEFFDCIINKTLAENLFPGENPLGQVILLEDGYQSDFSIQAVVKAVVSDAYFGSLYKDVKPAIFGIGNEFAEYFQIYYQEGKKDIALEKITNVFDELTKNRFFYFSIIDIEEVIKEFYSEDMVYLNIIVIIAIICTIIAVLGIYCMSSLHVLGSMKTLSILKVNGAGLKDLTSYIFLPYFFISLGAWIAGALIAHQIVDIYISRYSIVTTNIWIFYPVSLIIVLVTVFIPVFLNTRKAYFSNPSIYLNTE